MTGKGSRKDSVTARMTKTGFETVKVRGKEMGKGWLMDFETVKMMETATAKAMPMGSGKGYYLATGMG